MKTKGLLIGAWMFMLACILGGGLLGIYMIGKVTGDINYELFFPMLQGTIGGMAITAIVYFLRKKRRGNVPEFDERSAQLLKKYCLIVLYVLMIGSSLVVLVLFAMGVQTIETGMIAACLAATYLLIGVGALVVKQF